MSCAIGKRHTPPPLTAELHHIIPVAWQLHWQPPTAPFPGVDQDGRGQLWDARTVVLCPTHHRNVHYWIVRFMHGLAQPAKPKPDQAVALGALDRFVAEGGSLDDLRGVHLWGSA